MMLALYSERIHRVKWLSATPRRKCCASCGYSWSRPTGRDISRVSAARWRTMARPTGTAGLKCERTIRPAAAVLRRDLRFTPGHRRFLKSIGIAADESVAFDRSPGISAIDLMNARPGQENHRPPPGTRFAHVRTEGHMPRGDKG